MKDVDRVAGWEADISHGVGNVSLVKHVRCKSCPVFHTDWLVNIHGDHSNKNQTVLVKIGNM